MAEPMPALAPSSAPSSARRPAARKRLPHPHLPAPRQKVEEEPEPEPGPEPVPAGLDPEEAQAILDGVLDTLGAAHHRPFSRA